MLCSTHLQPNILTGQNEVVETGFTLTHEKIKNSAFQHISPLAANTGIHKRRKTNEVSYMIFLADHLENASRL